MPYPTAPGATTSKPVNLGNLVYPEDLGSVPFYMSLRAIPFPRNIAKSQLSNLISPVLGLGGSSLSLLGSNNISQAIQQRTTEQASASNVSTNQTTCYLPIPMKINDVQTLTWSQESVKAIASQLSGGVLGFADYATAPFGVTINPFLFMMFHSPNYKTYDMSWQLVPDNEEESDILSKIIDFIKYESSPESRLGVLLDYPSAFIIQFYPKKEFDKFTFRRKTVIVEAVAVDYTSGNIPSFHKNAAPVSISLTIRFKEIDVWLKDKWSESV